MGRSSISPPCPEIARLPKRIKMALRSDGRGVTEIARQAGISHTTIRRWLRGEQSDGATADGLIKLSKATGVRPAWLVLGENPMRDGDVRCIGKPTNKRTRPSVPTRR
jgi:transcriptional regulator with XRE-family HTH domain